MSGNRIGREAGDRLVMSDSDRPLRVIMLDAFPFPTNPGPDETPSDEPDLDDPAVRLGEAVREVYIQSRRMVCNQPNFGDKRMPRYDGGVDAQGRRHKSVWPRVAATIISIGADPFIYIKAQFRSVRIDKPPLPNQLYGESAVAKFRLLEHDSKQILRDALQSQTLSVHGTRVSVETALQWPFSRALRYALNNLGRVTATPLLRYCLAKEYEFEDIADSFHLSALIQYTFQRKHYDDVWGSIIPSSLKTEGASLAQALLGSTSST